MKYSSISFGRTLSDGNFGSFRADVTAELSEGDCLQSCMNSLKELVDKNLNADILDVSQIELPIETVEIDHKVLDKIVEEKPKKKVSKKVAKKVAKKAVKKPANVVYDRNLQPHKTMFLAMATELGLRDGKTPEDKAALKNSSEFMEGIDMFEAGTTDILDSFKEIAMHQFQDFKKQASVDV